MIDILGELIRSLGRKGDVASITGSANAKLASLMPLIQGTTQVSVIRKSLQAFGNVTAGGVAWTLGAYVEFAAAGDLAAHELVGLLSYWPGGNAEQHNIEVAVGGMGAEVVVWRVPAIRSAASDIPNIWPIVPAVQIPANARVACRSASSQISAGMYIALVFAPRPI